MLIVLKRSMQTFEMHANKLSVSSYKLLQKHRKGQYVKQNYHRWQRYQNAMVAHTECSIALSQPGKIVSDTDTSSRYQNAKVAHTECSLSVQLKETRILLINTENEESQDDNILTQCKPPKVEWSRH